MFIATIALALVAAACGDDDGAEETAERAGARAVAESLRARLLADELGEDEHLRDIAMIQEAVGDLPGEPDVSGIEDRDADGRDDDGEIEVRVDGETACVSIGDRGDEVDVTGGRC
ncbi:MAG: hypothetical protein M3144_01105 [Actinomycetota bacterium]|nr:hypothetical protein [Actinomycetota bacterium]